MTKEEIFEMVRARLADTNKVRVFTDKELLPI